MSGITLAQAQAQLDAWLAASLAVANNQSYSIAGRSLTRANASDISDQVDKWQMMVNKLSTTKNKLRYVVPQ